jgi:hypothetical protein
LEFFSDHFARGRQWYAQHFAHPERPIQGEFSPLYMDHPHVAARIAETYPQVTILAVLRNPFDRAISNLLHDIRFLEGQVATTEFDRIRRQARSDEKYVRRSCYADALAPYYRRFPRGQITVLYYDRLIAVYRSFLAELYSAVGAAADFVPERISPINRTDDYISPTLYRGLRRISGIAKTWRPTRAVLEWTYRHTRLREWVLFQLTADRGRPEVEFEDVFGRAAALRIAADVERLRSEIQLDVPAGWSQPAAFRLDASQAA